MAKEVSGGERGGEAKVNVLLKDCISEQEYLMHNKHVVLSITTKDDFTTIPDRL